MATDTLIERIVQRFGPQLEAQENSERAAAHARAAELMIAKRAQADKHHKESARKLHNANVAAAATRTELERVDRELLELRHAIATATLGFDQEIDRLDAELRRSASPRIDAAIAELRAEHDQLLGRSPTMRVDLDTPVGMHDRPPLLSTTRSVADRMQALRSAMAQLEEFKLLPLSDGELEKRIAAVQARLPELELETLTAPPAGTYQRPIAHIVSPARATVSARIAGDGPDAA
jgi:hypothetical protein